MARLARYSHNGDKNYFRRVVLDVATAASDLYDEQAPKISDRELAKSHDKEWFVAYKLLEDHGIYVDVLWDKKTIQDQFRRYKREYSGTIGNKWHANRQTIETNYRYKLAKFEREYDQLRQS